MTNAIKVLLQMTSVSLQPVPSLHTYILVPQRKQACADNKRDSKLTKINFLYTILLLGFISTQCLIDMIPITD
jgi:hypothetical protein